MNETISELHRLIDAELEGKKPSMEFHVAEHIKELVGNSEQLALIAIEDFKASDHVLKDINAAIRKEASKYSCGRECGISDKAAEPIIREMLGFPNPEEEPQADISDTAPGIVNLADYL